MAAPGAGFIVGQSPASRLPIGLLGALGIKTLGRYPTTLRDDYQCTMEVWDIIHASAFQASRTAVSVNWDLATVGNNLHVDTNFIVPQNEVWYVPPRCYAVGFSALTATFGAQLYYVMGGAASFDQGARYVSDAQMFVFPPYTVNARPALSNPEAFWLPPGSTLGWRNVLGAVGPAAVGGFTIQSLRMPA